MKSSIVGRRSSLSSNASGDPSNVLISVSNGDAVKSKIPALKFQAEIWTSPFDTIEKTFEGTPESLLERQDLLPTLLDFDVILFLQEEASVRQTWNAKKTGGEAVSSTGSFHGDTPSKSNTNTDSASMQQEKKSAA